VKGSSDALAARIHAQQWSVDAFVSEQRHTA